MNTSTVGRLRLRPRASVAGFALALLGALGLALVQGAPAARADVTGVTATADNSQVAGAATGYTVRFDLGAAGALGDGDTISITFAAGTTMPASLSAANFSVSCSGGGGARLPDADPTVAGQVLVVDVPAASTCGNSNAVTVEVEPAAGMANATTAGATSLGVATSVEPAVVTNAAAYTITHAAANKLAVVREPSGAVAGRAFQIQPIVQIQDVFGNAVTSGGSSDDVVTASLVGGTGVLSGDVTIAAVNGIATFKDLEISSAGSGKQLRFTTAGLITADTLPFEVTAPLPTTTPASTLTDGDVKVAVTGTTTLTIAGGDDAVFSTGAPDGSSVSITVPGGSMPDDSRVSVSPVADIASLTSQAPLPGSMAVAAAFIIQAVEADGDRIRTFNQPVTLAFRLAPGPVAAAAGTLHVAYWDGDRWVLVDAAETSNVDGSLTLSAEVDHFTPFAVVDLTSFYTGVAPPAGIGLLVAVGAVQPDVLASELIADGCNVTSLSVTVGGQFVTYVVGAPAFVNAAFPASLAAGAPFIVRCG